MIFTPTTVAGTFVIDLERRADQRGYFARTWCYQEFADHGLDVQILQTSVSYNHRAGTLRGLHFTRPPSHEDKLVRCERGAVHDVVLDLRPDSPTFMKHFAIELNQENVRALYIPAGCAHGFMTLVDDAEVHYMMTDVYRPELSDGVRFDDRAFGIHWPRRVTVIDERDRRYPDFDRETFVRTLCASECTARID